ncbi:MAG TPA: hypothetical protein VIG57_01835, partial [Candidatus Entotheonella sp.]
KKSGRLFYIYMMPCRISRGHGVMKNMAVDTKDSMSQFSIGWSRQFNLVAGGKPAATNPVNDCGAQH